MLDHHNDQTSATLALDILVDNFVLCDLVAAKCIFEKYAGEFVDPAKRVHCVTPEDWLTMVRSRDLGYAALLSHGAGGEEPARRDGDGWLTQLELPRTFRAVELRTRDGVLLNGEIVGVSRDGVLFYGPYANLPPGHYVASVTTTTLDGTGTLLLSVTAEAGKRFITNKKIKVGHGVPPRIEVAFDITGAEARGLEVVCDITGVKEIAVSGLTIPYRTAPDAAPPKWSLRRVASLP